MKKIESHIPYDKAKLHKILEHTPFPLTVVEGPKHRYSFLNRSARDTFFPDRDVLGLTVAEAVPETTSQGIVQRLDDVYRTGQRYDGREIEFHFKDDAGNITKTFILNVTFEPIFDDRGKVEGILSHTVDVTEMVKTRDRLIESEIYFRQVLDSSPAMLWITDENSMCTYLSKQWYEFTGRTPEQDLGTGWLDNIHPEDLPETARIYTKAVSNKGPLRVDYRLRKKTGEYRWAVDIGYPRFEKDGRFIGYIGTVTDIHDRIVMEHRLKEIQSRFDRSARATDLGIWYCDLPFSELIWNDEVKRHFFLQPDTRVDIDLFYARIHPDDREKTRRAIDIAIANRTPYSIIYRTVDPDNAQNVKHIHALGWTDYAPDGSPTRFDGITLDVTSDVFQREENVKARRAAEESRAEADRANATKSAFLANMSHEIRTPLGAILGFSELLKDSSSSSERAEFAQVISRNGKALTRLIDDILDLSKVEAGRLELEFIDLELAPLMDDVLALFSETARSKGVALSCHFEKEVPRWVKSDPARLRQILVNLVGNAVKFTAHGSVAVSVHSQTLTDQRSCIEFRIQDTGIGMSPAQLTHLFRPFVQADDTTTRRFGGTGLGLALSRKLAEVLGGTVKVLHCEQGAGCTFSFSVEVHVAQEPAKTHRRPSGSSVSSDPSALRVLLVEDSLDNQVLVKHVLTSQGMQVDLAENGIEAIKKAFAADYDVLLMDMQMPILDGYAATRQLRERGYEKPIIALTAHAMAEEGKRILASGCNEHLTKPINFEQLLKTIYEHARSEGSPG